MIPTNAYDAVKYHTYECNYDYHHYYNYCIIVMLSISSRATHFVARGSPYPFRRRPIYLPKSPSRQNAKI